MDFQKLEVWKLSARLSADIYRELRELSDWGFKDQITRSGLSVPSNIAEGMTRETNKEKIRFLVIGNSSCAELRTQIFIGMDINYTSKPIGNDWIARTTRVSVMIDGLKKRIRSDTKR